MLTAHELEHAAWSKVKAQLLLLLLLTRVLARCVGAGAGLLHSGT